jgi:putative sterol carrier protein
MGMSLDSHLLSLTTLFDPEKAGDFEATIQLHFGEHTFSTRVAGGRIEVARGEAPAADAVVTSDPGTFLAITHGRVALDDALAGGELEIDGNAEVVARLVTLFTLPAPAFA